MMRRRQVVGALLFLSVAYVSGFPAADLLMIQPGSDTAVVESTIREVRAAIPTDLEGAGSKKAFVHTYGDEADDDNTHGYHKRTEDKGSDGYKHYDSYHKKDGDKYGYEKHSQYGYGEHQDTGASNKNEKYAKPNEQKRQAAETKTAYQVIEDADGESDGDSGHYTADEGESGGYIEGDSGSYHGGGGDESSYSTGGGGSSSYSSGGDDGGGYSGGYSEGEGSSGHYTAASDGEGDGESEHYAEEGDESDY